MASLNYGGIVSRWLQHNFRGGGRPKFLAFFCIENVHVITLLVSCHINIDIEPHNARVHTKNLKISTWKWGLRWILKIDRWGSLPEFFQFWSKMVPMGPRYLVLMGFCWNLSSPVTTLRANCDCQNMFTICCRFTHKNTIFFKIVSVIFL